MRPKPLEAFLFGALAGAAGSLIQNLFFKATARVAPGQPEGAFTPPEPEQRREPPTQTVARRAVESFAKRGPLDERDRERSQAIVHYAFGSAWGGAYGLVRESLPGLDSPLGTVLWSSVVWMVSDNLILPGFRLAGWPRAYPAKNHLYAWAAHVVYGGSVWGAYRLLRARPWLGAASAATAWWQIRRVPAPLRPSARPVVAGLGWLARARRAVPEIVLER
jgi:hypothetical protein